MTNFVATIINGTPTFPNKEIALKFQEWKKKKNGRRVQIGDYEYESQGQRGFFEGAVVKIATYFEDYLDYHDSKDCKYMRDWLKAEFNPVWKKIQGEMRRCPGSTKGKLNDGVVEKIINWLVDQNGIDPFKVLNPQIYKDWRDRIFPYGGPDNFVDYLVSIGDLPPKTQGSSYAEPLTPVRE